jgi:hypothetical protein
MSAPRREYDPARRPNTFYKGDPASDAELQKRADDRWSYPRTTDDKIRKSVGETIGMDMESNNKEGAKVSKDGKTVRKATFMAGGVGYGTISSGNMPIRGADIAEGRRLARKEMNSGN